MVMKLSKPIDYASSLSATKRAERTVIRVHIINMPIVIEPTVNPVVACEIAPVASASADIGRITATARPLVRSNEF